MDTKALAAFGGFIIAWLVAPTERLPMPIQVAGAVAIFAGGVAAVAVAARRARH